MALFKFDDPLWYIQGDGYLDIFVRVTPHCKQVGVSFDAADPRPHKIKIGVNVAPEGGKANKAVIELLSDLIHLRKSAFTVHSGSIKRDKTIRIEGNSTDLLMIFKHTFTISD